MHSNVRFEEKLRCALATELGRMRKVRFRMENPVPIAIPANRSNNARV